MGLLQQFLIIALSYFLFYYSAPYWSSAQIKDVINHGSYQTLFILLSSVGDLLYKIVEKLSKPVDDLFKSLAEAKSIYSDTVHRAVHGAVNAAVYTVIIWGATYLYNGVSGLVLQGGGSYTLSFSEWSRVTNAATFLDAVRLRMEDAPGFWSGVGAAAVSMLQYTGITVLYSAFMYGLLRYKIREFNLGKRIFKNQDIRSPESDDRGFFSQVRDKLIPDLRNSIVNCLDNLCLLRSFCYTGSLILFCGGIFLYSLVMMFLNREPEVDGILAGILEASGVVDITLSFLIAFVWGKILSLLGITVYAAAPEPVKQFIDDMDDAGKGFVSTIEESRRTWAEDNDNLFNGTGGGGLHQMDLLSGRR